MSETQEFDPRYLEGIRLFNECEYFEAHDVWEDYWKDYHGDSRNFYKGLIQTAVCLHHFGNENIRGARKLYNSSRNYLLPFCPVHEEMDVEALLAGMESCCAEMLVAEGDFPDAKIDPELIPEIYLRPSDG